MMFCRLKKVFLLSFIAVTLPLSCVVSITDMLNSFVTDINTVPMSQDKLWADYRVVSTAIFGNSSMSSDREVVANLGLLNKDLSSNVGASILAQDVAMLQASVASVLARIPTVASKLAINPCPYQLLYCLVVSKEKDSVSGVISSITRFVACYRVPYLVGSSLSYAYVPVSSDDSNALLAALGKPIGGKPIILQRGAGFDVAVLTSIDSKLSPAGDNLFVNQIVSVSGEQFGNIEALSWYLNDPRVISQLTETPIPFQKVGAILAVSKPGVPLEASYVSLYRVGCTLPNESLMQALVPVGDDDVSILNQILGRAAGSKPIITVTANIFDISSFDLIANRPVVELGDISEDISGLLPNTPGRGVGNIVSLSLYLNDPTVVSRFSDSPSQLQKTCAIAAVKPLNGVTSCFMSMYRVGCQLPDKKVITSLVPVDVSDARLLSRIIGRPVDAHTIITVTDSNFDISTFDSIANWPFVALDDITQGVSGLLPNDLGRAGDLMSLSLYTEDPRISVHLTKNPCPYPEVFGTIVSQAPASSGVAPADPITSVVRLYRVAYETLSGDIAYAYVPVSASDIQVLANAYGVAAKGLLGSDDQQVIFLDSKGFLIDLLGVVGSRAYRETTELQADLPNIKPRNQKIVGNLKSVSLSSKNPYLMSQGQGIVTPVVGAQMKVYVPPAATPYFELKNPTKPGVVMGAVSLEKAQLGTAVDVNLQAIKSFKSLGFYPSSDVSRTPVYFASYYYLQTVYCVDNSGSPILNGNNPKTASMYLGMVYNDEQDAWVDVSGIGFSADGKKRIIVGANVPEIIVPTVARNGTTSYASKYITAFDAERAGVTSTLYGSFKLDLMGDVPLIKPLLDVDLNILSLSGHNILRLTSIQEASTTTVSDVALDSENLLPTSNALTNGLLYPIPVGVENSAVLDGYGVKIPEDPNAGKPEQSVKVSFYEKKYLGVPGSPLTQIQVPYSAIVQTYPQQTASSKQDGVQLYAEYCNLNVFSEVFFALQFRLCPYYALINGVCYGLKPKPDAPLVNGQPVEFLSFGIAATLKDKIYSFAQGTTDTYIEDKAANTMVCLGNDGAFLSNPHAHPMANAYLIGYKKPYGATSQLGKVKGVSCVTSPTVSTLLSCSPLFFQFEDSPLSHCVRQFGSHSSSGNNTLVNRFISVAELQADPAIITLVNRMQPASWTTQGYSVLIKLIPTTGKARYGVLSVASDYLAASKKDMSLVVPGSYNPLNMYGIWVTGADGRVDQIESDFSISSIKGLKVLDPVDPEYALALTVVNKNADQYKSLVKSFNNIVDPRERAGTRAGNKIGKGIGKMFNAFSSAFS